MILKNNFDIDYIDCIVFGRMVGLPHQFFYLLG